MLLVLLRTGAPEQLYIAVDTVEVRTQTLLSETIIPIGITTQVRVTVRDDSLWWENADTVVYLYLNDTLDLSLELNGSRIEDSNVDVYLSDDHYNAGEASVKNVVISSWLVTCPTQFAHLFCSTSSKK